MEGYRTKLEAQPDDDEGQRETERDRMLRGLLADGSRELGDIVMNELMNVDQVAYVRFASVYRSFQDISEFRDAIERLEAEPALKTVD